MGCLWRSSVTHASPTHPNVHIFLGPVPVSREGLSGSHKPQAAEHTWSQADSAPNSEQSSGLLGFIVFPREVTDQELAMEEVS